MPRSSSRGGRRTGRRSRSCSAYRRKEKREQSVGHERGRLRSWSRENSLERARGSGARRDGDEDVPKAIPPPRQNVMKQQPVKRVRKELFQDKLGYNNDSNPFGDSTLTDKFVWKKKNEYLAAAGLYRGSSKDQEIDRIQSKIVEIHQVKKRRDEREVERKLLEQQRLEHDRDRHDEEFGEWLDKEEKFHLNSAKARSLIRIEQGREKPIDLVAKGLAIAENEEFEDMTILDKPPHQLFAHLPLEEVEDMVPEIEIFVKNDSLHKKFWKSMLYVCQDAIESKQREKIGASKPGAALSGLGAGVAEGVLGEIHELLSAKKRRELEDMLSEIKTNIQKGAEGVDTQFFDAVASKIPLYIARAEIEDWHQKAKKRSDEWTEARNKEPAPSEAPTAPGVGITAPSLASSSGVGHQPATNASGDWDDLPDGRPSDSEDLSPKLEPLSVLEEQPTQVKGAFSPLLEPISAFDPQDLLDPLEDERIMRQVRQTLIEAFRGPGGGASIGSSVDVDRSRDEELFNAEKAKGMPQGEVGFNAKGKGTGDEYHGEIELPKRQYEWEDKYRPRKPRFFNRVKTGYEWNKYNQTHYDHDNPPPKQVQGYKFNIFFPDLIDKTKAPTYYIERSDSAETCTLRFHAGPPYEDVAFKIVNREWQLSHKFGFRVVFDRGVLQLYFNFKRWRYRR
eukprot:TRINITY_DN35992_c0_g1_i1.p1 TRINITY_DN35992_c0_g1~~TRINITY_DN35992_c0_g1_i1.p1  ORF type:complete len:677 (-),score=121.41 TRINITY_DN35992_c0_g1_i1:286-2316(-)